METSYARQGHGFNQFSKAPNQNFSWPWPFSFKNESRTKVVAANQHYQVKVIHGACDAEFDLAGASVGSVRSTLVDAFNISADALALLNGKQVEWGYRLRGGERLEFVKPWGRKAGCELDGKLLTVKEAADELRCSISFVYKLMEIGQIAFERRGRRKLPLAASISEYRQMSRVEGSSQPPAVTVHAPGRSEGAVLPAKWA